MKKILLFCLFISNIYSHGQALFERTYGGIDNDKAYSIIETYDGNYVFTGETRSSITYEQIFYTVKINSYGDIIWEVMEEIDRTRGLCVIESYDNGIIVAGDKNVGNDFYPMLLKYDENGNKLWEKDLSEVNIGAGAYNIVERENHDLAFTSKDGAKACIVSVDKNGTFLWKKNYNSNGKSTFGLAKTIDNGLISCGGINAEGVGPYRNSWIVKLDDEQNTAWSENYGGENSRSGFYDIETISDGGFIACGSWFNGSVILHGKFYIVKTNANGDLVWEKRISGPNQDDDLNGLAVTECNDGYIACGNYRDPSSYDKVYVVKLDFNGDTIWTKKYGGVYTDEAWDIIQTSDGVFLVCGYTQNNTNGSYDVYIIKMNDDGQTVGINERAKNIVEVYPNPTSDFIFIEVNNTLLSIQLSDMNGRLIKVYQPYSGVNRLRLNLNDLPSGCYSLQLIFKDKIEIRKILKH